MLANNGNDTRGFPGDSMDSRLNNERDIGWIVPVTSKPDTGTSESDHGMRLHFRKYVHCLCEGQWTRGIHPAVGTLVVEI
jgi:hypothetical protein